MHRQKTLKKSRPTPPVIIGDGDMVSANGLRDAESPVCMQPNVRWLQMQFDPRVRFSKLLQEWNLPLFIGSIVTDDELPVLESLPNYVLDRSFYRFTSISRGKNNRYFGTMHVRINA